MFIPESESVFFSYQDVEVEKQNIFAIINMKTASNAAVSITNV